jgi:hypothetical protein
MPPRKNSSSKTAVSATKNNDKNNKTTTTSPALRRIFASLSTYITEENYDDRKADEEDLKHRSSGIRS